MGIRMVRQPSETPNVTNIDDIIPFRYAYGDQNGYVIGKGNEISYTIEGNTFRINSGRVVLQGVETDIDANGVSFTIDNASETRYFAVYYEVNLATQTTSIKLSNYSTSDYPTIDAGDDLTANSSGIARLPLYIFSATSGVISNVTKTAKPIEYSGTALVGYDISKGTVEERLSKLGFKSGSISSSLGGTTIENSIKRQGNYVIVNFNIKSSVDSPWSLSKLNNSGNIPENFRPKSNVTTYALLDSSGTSYSYHFAKVTISTNGDISIVDYMGLTGYTIHQITFNAGYESNPLI